MKFIEEGIKNNNEKNIIKNIFIFIIINYRLAYNSINNWY